MEELVTRKKLAMPSVVPNYFTLKLREISNKAYAKKESHPYSRILGDNTLSYLMIDILKKYLIDRPKGNFEGAEWKEDLLRMEKNHEPIIHW